MMKKKELKERIESIKIDSDILTQQVRKLREDLIITRNMLDLSESALSSAERALAYKETQLQNAAKHSADILRYTHENYL